MLNMDELQPKAGYADTETASSGGSQQVSEQTIAEQEASYAHAAPRITLSQLVNLCIEKGASDIHFREGGRVSLRVGGKMIFIENIESLTKDETMDMVKELMQNDREIKKLENVKETDFSYTYSNGVNFRVNLFFQKGKIAGVMRMISKHVPSMSELGIPEAVKSILNNREGLILVCGTAGSGKSTSVQSMIEYINNNFVKHIITIENPIEYVFEDKKSIITQREIGKDTLSANAALKSATREDANIIMVSEICSYEMLDELLDLVETGHLVIATMLTKDSSQTAERILSLYPQDLKKRAQDRVASDLIAIVSQDLVQRQDQQGLIAIFELMFMNPSISQIIKRGNFVQLRTAIQAGGEEGMITMDRYAYELAHQGIISQNIAAEYQQREEQ